MIIFNEHRSKHSIFAFSTPSKHRKEMRLGKIGMMESRANPFHSPFELSAPQWSAEVFIPALVVED